MTFTLDPASDFTSSETCTLTVAGAEVVDQDGVANAMAGNAVITFSTVEVCGEPSTRIHTIQSNGLVSLLTGSSQVIEGVVTSDLQGPGQFGGYFVQQEDALADGDPATSEGLFVFNTSVPVAVGDKVRVRGTVVEFGNAGATLTELSSVTTALVCASAQPLPDASVLDLPVAVVRGLRALRGHARHAAPGAHRQRNLRARPLRRAGALVGRPAAAADQRRRAGRRRPGAAGGERSQPHRPRRHQQSAEHRPDALSRRRAQRLEYACASGTA